MWRAEFDPGAGSGATLEKGREPHVNLRNKPTKYTKRTKNWLPADLGTGRKYSIEPPWAHAKDAKDAK